MCTLYKGVPHGLAIILCTKANDSYENFGFKAVGVFNQGELNKGPFLWTLGNKEEI